MRNVFRAILLALGFCSLTTPAYAATFTAAAGYVVSPANGSIHSPGSIAFSNNGGTQVYITGGTAWQYFNVEWSMNLEANGGRIADIDAGSTLIQCDGNGQWTHSAGTLSGYLAFTPGNYTAFTWAELKNLNGTDYSKNTSSSNAFTVQ